MPSPFAFEIKGHIRLLFNVALIGRNIMIDEMIEVRKAGRDINIVFDGITGGKEMDFFA